MPRGAKTKSKIPEIVQDMRRRIEQGSFGIDGRIPSRSVLSKEYGAGNATINYVLSFLNGAGYTTIDIAGGSIMANHDKITMPILVPSFDTWLLQHNRSPYMKNLAIETVTVNTLQASIFGLPEGSQMIQRSRVQGELMRKAEIPYRITENLYHFSYAQPHLETFRANPLFNLAKQIEQDTGPIVQSDLKHLIIRYPTLEEQKILQIPYNTALLDTYRISRTANGIGVMYSHLIMISYRFEINIPDIETHL